MNFKKTVFLLLIAAAVLKSTHVGAQSRIDKGVSEQLAESRKKSLNNINYKLDFTIPEDSTADIRVREIIGFDLLKKGKPLIIDFKERGEHIKGISLNGKACAYNLINEHIVLAAALLKKGRNEVSIDFIAGNTPLTRRKEYLYTLLVPERARMFFPCFDQPDLKATFSVEASIPADWQMITNGILLTEKKEGNSRRLSFDVSDKISTYLFSVVAGRFSRESRVIDGRPMNFYYRETDREKLAESMDSVFVLHRESLRFLENYTGIRYPFKKFDFIALADLAYGGMEHAGAIDYRAGSLFLSKDADQRQRLNRINLIAHETSHMWFGNLVTMKWFNDVWMKEVFANFMADKVAAELMPGYQNDLSFMMAHHPAAYAVDRSEGSHPIRQHLNNLNNAASLYGSVIYHKAPIAMNQLELIIGKEKLRQALQTYLTRYAGGNADWPQLIDIISEGGAKNIVDWNQNWINSPARALVSYDMEVSGDKISRFSILQKDPQGKGKTWDQRLSLALIYPDTIKRVQVELRGASSLCTELSGMEIPLYIVCNSGGEGYALFPMEQGLADHLEDLKDPVMRGSAYLNLYENVLEGRIMAPRGFVVRVAEYLEKESNDLIVSHMSGGLTNIYWQFLRPGERELLAPELEAKLLRISESSKSPAKKKAVFKLYVGLSISGDALAKKYTFWEKGSGPGGVRLNEDDMIYLATDMALKGHSNYEDILRKQGQKISNADRKNRFNYVLPALSSRQAVRDRFFYALEKDRKNESYLVEALAYLHHPLRNGASEKYLLPSLQWLEMIKASSGIFFPTDWISSTFGSYQSAYAEQVVRNFLRAHPDFDPALRLKILQECDDLFRSRRILEKEDQ